MQQHPPAAPNITHYGGCHCGAVRYTARAPAALTVTDCNCSICSKAGYLHLLVRQEDFQLLSGADQLTVYTFRTGIAKHLFCKVCGIKSYYVPRSHPKHYSVNARCLDPGTVTGLTIQAFDGQHWEQQIDSLLRSTPTLT